MNCIRRFASVVLFLAFAQAHAATITVGPAEGIPSLARALKRARAGDTILIRQGVYIGHVLVPGVGVKTAPLVIRAAPGERVVLDARGAEYGIEIAPGAGWVTIENLIVVRARSFGLYARPAHDLVVRGCTFARNGTHGLYVRQVDGMTVENCHFHHNRVNGAVFNGVRRLTVSDCMAYLHPAAPGSSENFGMYATGCEGGVFERNALFLNDKSGFRIVNSPGGNIVRGNVTYLNGWTGFDINSRSHKHLYVNNLMVRNMCHGINVKGFSRDDRVVNNTIFGNRATAVTVNNRAHNNFFRSNLFLGSPYGYSYDTRVGWDQRDSDHNIFDCGKPISQLDSIAAARKVGLEHHSLLRPVRFAANDPFDFRLPDNSPLHQVAVDAGFGKAMGALKPTWRGPRLIPVRLKVIGASGNVGHASLTTDGSVYTTWNSGVTENAWIEYEIVDRLPGPLAFAIICPTMSTRLPEGDLPGPFTLRVAYGKRQPLYEGELYVRRSGLARARGQCFELSRQARARRVRLELHKAVDGNYNGRIENICLSEIMLIAALDPLPESLAEFPYDEVAPVPASALEAARRARSHPAARVPDAALAQRTGLLFYLPFEDPARAAYARGDAQVFIEGAEYLPGIAGKGAYLPRLSGNTCSAAAPDNLNPDQGTFSAFLKPLVPWNSKTVGSQNYQFIVIAYRANLVRGAKVRPSQGAAELRLAYVNGGFQVVGGVVYNGPQEFRMSVPLELAAGRWYHVGLTWSKAANQTVLYLNGKPIGRAKFGAGLDVCNRISLGCFGASHQSMAVMDEVKVFGGALSVQQVRNLASPPRRP